VSFNTERGDIQKKSGNKEIGAHTKLKLRIYAHIGEKSKTIH
jgi:hypothetical protein